MRYLLLALLLAGCTEQEFNDFSSGFAEGAANLRAGTQSWRRPVYYPPPQVYVQPEVHRTTMCQTIGNMLFCN